MEVYRALYDNDMASVWARPQAMFHEEVSPGQKRFTEVGRVRTMMPEDESTYLEFGYDAWGGGLSRTEFVNTYKTDPNHLRGTRYLLESPSGEPIGNLNTLRFAKGLVGIASVSVNPVLRGRGHGSTLIRAAMELLRGEDPSMRFILFSEVHPAMYERLGFRQIDDAYQFHRPAIAMISGQSAITEREISFLVDYF